MCGINTKGFQNISNILLQNNINEINVNNIERVMNFVGSIIKDIHIYECTQSHYNRDYCDSRKYYMKNGMQEYYIDILINMDGMIDKIKMLIIKTEDIYYFVKLLMLFKKSFGSTQYYLLEIYSNHVYDHINFNRFKKYIKNYITYENNAPILLTYEFERKDIGAMCNPYDNESKTITFNIVINNQHSHKVEEYTYINKISNFIGENNSINPCYKLSIKNVESYEEIEEYIKHGFTFNIGNELNKDNVNKYLKLAIKYNSVGLLEIITRRTEKSYKIDESMIEDIYINEYQIEKISNIIDYMNDESNINEITEEAKEKYIEKIKEYTLKNKDKKYKMMLKRKFIELEDIEDLKRTIEEKDKKIEELEKRLNNIEKYLEDFEEIDDLEDKKIEELEKRLNNIEEKNKKIENNIKNQRDETDSMSVLVIEKIEELTKINKKTIQENDKTMVTKEEFNKMVIRILAEMLVIKENINKIETINETEYDTLSNMSL